MLFIVEVVHSTGTYLLVKRLYVLKKTISGCNCVITELCQVTSAVQRMLFVSPYMFMLLCVLNEYQIFPRIEQICDSPADKIARLVSIVCYLAIAELFYLNVVIFTRHAPFICIHP